MALYLRIGTIKGNRLFQFLSVQNKEEGGIALVDIVTAFSGNSAEVLHFLVSVLDQFKNFESTR